MLNLNVSAQFSGLDALTMTAPAGATGVQWYDYSSGSSVIITGETGNSYTTAVPGIYYYKDTLPNGTCEDEQTVYIIINEDETLVLDAGINNVGAYDFLWQQSGAVLTGEVNAQLSVASGGLYSLSFSTNCRLVTSNYFELLQIWTTSYWNSIGVRPKA